MKKNIQINLFGALYNIDEDAYQLLENYLKSMKRYFSRQEGGAEIADDIEHRVAELLWARKENGMEAVSNDVIREIIAQIGNPEEIAPEDTITESPADSDTANTSQNETSGEGTSTTQDWKTAFEKAADGAQKTAQTAYNKVRTNTQGKKLYRDPSDKILGGVCSGLAQYFGGDVVLWRVILAALFILQGFGLILYIILWIVVPKAITPEDRLRMTGQPVTPNTLNTQILQDQATPQPQPSNHSGCLKVFLIILILLIGVPFFLGLLSIIFAGVIGVSGGLIGGFFGLAGSLIKGIFCLIGLLLQGLCTILFGRGGSDIIYGNTLLFWSGIAMLVIAFVLIIYSIIHAVRSNSKPLSWGARLFIVLTIASCILLGCYNIQHNRSFNNRNWSWGSIQRTIEIKDDMKEFKNDMRKLQKDMREMQQEMNTRKVNHNIVIKKTEKKKEKKDSINTQIKLKTKRSLKTDPTKIDTTKAVTAKIDIAKTDTTSSLRQYHPVTLVKNKKNSVLPTK